MMYFFAERMKIIVETTGCLAAAAVRAEGGGLKGKRVGVLVSGGNVDLSRFANSCSMCMRAAGECGSRFDPGRRSRCDRGYSSARSVGGTVVTGTE